VPDQISNLPAGAPVRQSPLPSLLNCLLSRGSSSHIVGCVVCIMIRPYYLSGFSQYLFGRALRRYCVANSFWLGCAQTRSEHACKWEANSTYYRVPLLDEPTFWDPERWMHTMNILMSWWFASVLWIQFHVERRTLVQYLNRWSRPTDYKLRKNMPNVALERSRTCPPANSG